MGHTRFNAFDATISYVDDSRPDLIHTHNNHGAAVSASLLKDNIIDVQSPISVFLVIYSPSGTLLARLLIQTQMKKITETEWNLDF